MKTNNSTEGREKSSAGEWLWNYKHEARAALILFHGIDNPTEKQIYMYILYGERSVKKA